jgi:N utilization substance protein A
LLGDLAPDLDEANEIIMAARAHWFDGETAATPAAEATPGSEPESEAEPESQVTPETPSKPEAEA